ncbi:hypothetical protein B0T19DRAFT_398554 [Cercophora scortea]|uniref:Myb-like domain-containing protein n=1 Tax=Cercophora scortea TaxID=314031 RepID=A0AAE0IX72_9PEZI|nr:hypothetical protein B0T19DRAFT_398554 [Cercophora scortea]
MGNAPGSPRRGNYPSSPLRGNYPSTPLRSNYPSSPLRARSPSYMSTSALAGHSDQTFANGQLQQEGAASNTAYGVHTNYFGEALVEYGDAEAIAQSRLMDFHDQSVQIHVASEEGFGATVQPQSSTPEEPVAAHVQSRQPTPTPFVPYPGSAQEMQQDMDPMSIFSPVGPSEEVEQFLKTIVPQAGSSQEMPPSPSLAFQSLPTTPSAQAVPQVARTRPNSNKTTKPKPKERRGHQDPNKTRTAVRWTTEEERLLVRMNQINEKQRPTNAVMGELDKQDATTRAAAEADMWKKLDAVNAKWPNGGPTRPLPRSHRQSQTPDSQGASSSGSAELSPVQYNPREATPPRASSSGSAELSPIEYNPREATPPRAPSVPRSPAQESPSDLYEEDSPPISTGPASPLPVANHASGSTVQQHQTEHDFSNQQFGLDRNVFDEVRHEYSAANGVDIAALHEKQAIQFIYEIEQNRPGFQHQGP